MLGKVKLIGDRGGAVTLSRSEPRGTVDIETSAQHGEILPLPAARRRALEVLAPEGHPGHTALNAALVELISLLDHP